MPPPGDVDRESGGESDSAGEVAPLAGLSRTVDEPKYILSASFLLLCFRAIPTVTTLARRIAPAAPADRSPPGCCWAADAAEGERCSSSLLPRAGERRAFGVE